MRVSSIWILTFDCAAISFSELETPPRVGSRRQRMAVSAGDAASMAATRLCSAAESLTISVSNSSPSRLAKNRDAVIADGSAQDHPVARAGLAGGQTHAVRHDADAGGVDEQAVALAALDNLGVAGDDGDAGRGRCFGHRRCDQAQGLGGKAFFKNEPGAQKQRPRAAHREIVHGAMHGERSDVAAGEKQRLDHERIGGEGDASAADFDDGLIVHAVEHGIGEQRQEDVAQKFRAQPAARAVAEHDAVALWERRRANERIDFGDGSGMVSGMGHRMASVLVISGASAFGRNHGRAERRHRRAACAEGRAIERLLQSLED